jgi:hypothetical protein
LISSRGVEVSQDLAVWTGVCSHAAGHDMWIMRFHRGRPPIKGGRQYMPDGLLR